MRESWFVIWKQIRNRRSDAQVRPKIVRGARESSWTVAATCGGRVPHGQRCSLPPCGTRAPHGPREVMWANFLLCPFSCFPLLSPKSSLHSIQEVRLKNTCPENFLSTFLTFQTPYLPHTKSDWVDSSWRLFVIEFSTFSKWFGSCLIDFSGPCTQKTEPALSSKVVN